MSKLFKKKQVVFTIRVNYKSGGFEEFDVTEFKASKDGSSFEWTLADNGKQVKPIYFGIDNVESVWQIGAK